MLKGLKQKKGNHRLICYATAKGIVGASTHNGGGGGGVGLFPVTIATDTSILYKD
jgi:hypothetical protein